MNRFAIAFGSLFLVIGSVYLYMSNDIGGAFMILALGVAMATMTSIVAHAMDTDN